MPVHLVIVSQASAGKSFTLQSVLRLFPDEAHHTIPAGSPRVLIYDDANLQHRAVIFGEAVTVLRQAHRKRDAKGRLIATIEDYATVYELVGPMFEATLTGATKELRATVQAVEEMLRAGQAITATSLAARLGINRGTASRRVAAAIRRNWLINRETRRGQPWDLALGEPLPDQEGLPTPDEVLHHQNFRATQGATPYSIDITKDTGECCTVARFTADEEKVFSRGITPGEEVPVCGGCRHFQPSPVNPPKALGFAAWLL